MKEAIIGAAIGALVSALASVFLYWRGKRDDKRRECEGYAAIWAVVLTEVGDALDRMRGQATSYLEKEATNMLEIELVPSLRDRFFACCQHPVVAKKLYGIYCNIVYYRNCYHLAIEETLRSGPQDFESRMDRLRKGNKWMGSALWIAQNRHARMVSDFGYCLTEFLVYLKENKVNHDPHLSEPKALDEKYRQQEGKDQMPGVAPDTAGT